MNFDRFGQSFGLAWRPCYHKKATCSFGRLASRQWRPSSEQYQGCWVSLQGCICNEAKEGRVRIIPAANRKAT